MSTLEYSGLVLLGSANKEILKPLDLTVNSGEVHAVTGPNAPASTLSGVVMGKPGYEVTAGTVTLDGVDVLTLAPWDLGRVLHHQIEAGNGALPRRPWRGRRHRRGSPFPPGTS